MSLQLTVREMEIPTEDSRHFPRSIQWGCTTLATLPRRKPERSPPLYPVPALHCSVPEGERWARVVLVAPLSGKVTCRAGRGEMIRKSGSTVTAGEATWKGTTVKTALPPEPSGFMVVLRPFCLRNMEAPCWAFFSLFCRIHSPSASFHLKVAETKRC